MSKRPKVQDGKDNLFFYTHLEMGLFLLVRSSYGATG